MKTKLKSSVGMMLLAAGLWGAAVAASATEIVVIVNPKNPATRMFSEQAAQFFLSKSTLFTPVERNDVPAVRTVFYQKVLMPAPSLLSPGVNNVDLPRKNWAACSLNMRVAGFFGLTMTTISVALAATAAPHKPAASNIIPTLDFNFVFIFAAP